MNIMQVLSTISNPKILQAVKQAWNIASNTPKSVQGFKDTINQLGGQQTLEKGLKALDDSRIKGVLGKYGVDTEAIKSFGTNFLNNNYKQQQAQNTSANNSYLDRLKRL